MNIKLYYDSYKNPKLGSGNLGDVLSKEIFSFLFGIKVCKSDMMDAECCSIGSVLDRFLENEKNNNTYNTINIWGSGFIEDVNSNLKFSGNLNFFAVRGFLTLEKLKNIQNKNISNLTVGDPGILASLLIKQKSKKYKLGIIPHFIDYDNKIFKEINKNIKGSKIINIVGNPIDKIKEISECEVIISTALHGIIVADSLGIPNMWCEVSNNVTGKGYKFRDYYSIYGIKNPKCLNLRDRAFDYNDLDNITKYYKINQEDVKKIQNNLISCFPYKNFIQSHNEYKESFIKKRTFSQRAKNSIKKRITRIKKCIR